VIPPVKLVPRVLKNLTGTPTVATLVVPLWKYACFWSMICDQIYNWVFNESGHTRESFSPGRTRQPIDNIIAKGV